MVGKPFRIVASITGYRDGPQLAQAINFLFALDDPNGLAISQVG
jgi:hypothetical protein